MKKYVFTKDQLEELFKEFILIEKLRRLTLDLAFCGNISIEDFEQEFAKVQSKLKLIKLTRKWDEKEKVFKFIVDFNENLVEIIQE